MARSSIVALVPGLDRGPSSWDRLANVVVDPGAAFGGISARPVWALAFAALVALRVGSLFVFYQPEASAAKLVAGVLFQVMTLLPLIAVLTTLLWSAAAVWRATLTWPSAWSLTTHVTFAYTLATVAAASAAGAFLPESAEVNLRSPPFTNLAFLVSDADAPALHALAAEADIRSAYAAVLAWVGVRAASDAHSGAAARIIATCFAVSSLVACSAALFR
jgi:hypothetical protein